MINIKYSTAFIMEAVSQIFKRILIRSGMVSFKPEALVYSINCIYGICQNHLVLPSYMFYTDLNILLYFVGPISSVTFELIFFICFLPFIPLAYIAVLYSSTKEYFESGKFPLVVKDILMRSHLLRSIMDLVIQQKMKNSILSNLNVFEVPGFASDCKYTG